MKKSYTNFIKLKSSKKHFNSKTIITICLRRATWWSKFDYKAIICEWWWWWWWRLFFLLFCLIKIHIFIYSSSLPLLNEISIMNIWRIRQRPSVILFSFWTSKASNSTFKLSRNIENWIIQGLFSLYSCSKPIFVFSHIWFCSKLLILGYQILIKMLSPSNSFFL